jgi:hypothetical protein
MQALKSQVLLKSSHFASSRLLTTIPSRFASNMTTGIFEYIDRASFVDSQEPFVKPWAKVDGPGYNFRRVGIKRSVQDLRGQEDEFSVNTSGFAVYNSPANEKSFTDDQAVRKGYYEEIEQLLREKLPGVKKVVIFDHVRFLTVPLRRFDNLTINPDHPTKRQVIAKTASSTSSRRPNARSCRSPRPTTFATQRSRRTSKGTISTNQRMATHCKPSYRFSSRCNRLAHDISQRLHQGRFTLPQAPSRA